MDTSEENSNQDLSTRYIVISGIIAFIYPRLRLVVAQITGNTFEEIYAKTKEVIEEQSGSTIWVPAKDPL